KTVRFATTGSHTLRIQTREDGVQIDQVVLSPATYLTSAPGQPSNDATIVPKPVPPPPPTTLPAPWGAQDVGATGSAGTSSCGTGVFTVVGAGADIWGTADSFRYVSQSASGDTQIVARVTGLQNTNTYAKAGVMIRETTAASSAHVVLDVRPNGSIEFMTRSANGAATAFIAGGTQTTPAWLKLVRSGGTATASISADGSTWTTVGTTPVTMAATATIGLAVTSHDTSQLNTATFDNVSVAVPLAPPATPTTPAPAQGATDIATNAS